jgi:hypothetical protein
MSIDESSGYMKRPSKLSNLHSRVERADYVLDSFDIGYEPTLWPIPHPQPEAIVNANNPAIHRASPLNTTRQFPYQYLF